VLAGLLGGHLPASSGLLPLALEAGAGAEIPTDAIWRQLVELDEEHNCLLLAGISDPRQSTALQSSLPWIADAFQGLKADVLADCGRLDAVAAVRPVLSVASLAVLVLRPTLRQVSRAQPRIEMLTGLLGRDRVVALLLGEGGASAREVARSLGVQVAGQLPEDPKTAAVLSDGLGSRHRLEGRPLLRAATAAGKRLRVMATSAVPLVGYPDDAVFPAGAGPARAVPAGADRAGLGEYGLDDPALNQRGRDQYAFDQPGFDQPGFDQRGFSQPGFDQRGFEQPSLGQRSLSPPSLSPPSLSPPSLSPPGLSPPSLSPPGLSPLSLSPPGLTPPGLSPPGLSLDGPSFDGFAAAPSPGQSSPGQFDLDESAPSPYGPYGPEEPAPSPFRLDEPAPSPYGPEEPGSGQPGPGQPGHDEQEPGRRRRSLGRHRQEEPGPRWPGLHRPADDQPHDDQPHDELPAEPPTGDEPPAGPPPLRLSAWNTGEPDLLSRRPRDFGRGSRDGPSMLRYEWPGSSPDGTTPPNGTSNGSTSNGSTQNGSTQNGSTQNGSRP
jgi:hypothetical protein